MMFSKPDCDWPGLLLRPGWLAPTRTIQIAGRPELRVRAAESLRF